MLLIENKQKEKIDKLMTQIVYWFNSWKLDWISQIKNVTAVVVRNYAPNIVPPQTWWIWVDPLHWKSYISVWVSAVSDWSLLWVLWGWIGDTNIAVWNASWNITSYTTLWFINATWILYTPNIAVNTNLLYTDSVNWKIWIWLTTPAYKLDILSDTQSYLNIQRVWATTWYFRIENYTATAWVFSAIFRWRSNWASYPWCTFLWESTVDSWTVAITQFISRFNNWAVVTRPLFQFMNSSSSSVAMTILANLNVWIWTVTPTTTLEVSSTGTEKVKIWGWTLVSQLSFWTVGWDSAIWFWNNSNLRFRWYWQLDLEFVAQVNASSKISFRSYAAVFQDSTTAEKMRFDLVNWRFWLLTATPNANLDILWTARFGDSVTNYTKFESDWTMQAIWTATTWEDANIWWLVLQWPVATLPWLVEILDSTGTGTGIFTRSFDVNEDWDAFIEIPHNSISSWACQFHIHFSWNTAPSWTTDKVNFQIIYMSTDEWDLVPTPTTITKEIVYDTQYKRITLNFDNVTLWSMKQIWFNIKRIAASANEYPWEVQIWTIWIHHQVDMLGSREITTK